MNYNRSFFGIFLAILVLIPGCIHVPTYRSKPLAEIRDHCAYIGTENNVMTRAQLLLKEDKIALFGDRGAWLHDKDIQIMQLSIHNLSDVDYVLCLTDIDLLTMSHRDVEKIMKSNARASFVQGIGFGAAGAGAIGWGVTGPMLYQSMMIAYVCLPLGVAAATAAFVFFGKSIKSTIMNKRIKKDLFEKIVPKKVIIKSGEKYEGLMFIKSADYKSQFDIPLYEKDNKNQLIFFDVDIRKNEIKAF